MNLPDPDDTMPRCYWCGAEYEDHELVPFGRDVLRVCDDGVHQYRELTEEDERDARDSIRMHEEGL